MRRLIVVVSGVLLLLSALATAASGTAAPPTSKAPSLPAMPAVFYGTVTVDGSRVSDGTEVTALINGVVYAKTTTITYGQDSVYVINVPADDPATPAKEGGAERDFVTFQVDGHLADQRAKWRSGSNTQSNLTVSTSQDGKKTPPGKLK